METGIFWAYLLIPLLYQGPLTERLGSLPGISEPHSLQIIGDDLIFLDGFTAHVYSLDPLGPKYVFGGEGEEPGHFRYWPELAMHGDTIVVTDFLRTQYFDLEGEWLETILYSDFGDFDPNMEMVLLPLGEGFLRITVDHDTSRRFVRLLRPDHTLVRTLYEGLYDWRGALPAFRIDVDSDEDSIVVSDSEKGFYLSIFDRQGNLLRTIDRSVDTEPVPFTDADRTTYLESVRLTQDPRLYEHLRQNGRFKDWFPAINHFQLDDGKVYVITNRMRDGNHELLILDLEGRLLKTLFLPLRSMSPSRTILRFDPYVIHQGKLYEMVRPEPTGSYELWVTDLEQPVGGSPPGES